MIIFVGREYTVYGDACHWETTVPDKPVTTVDEFVAALSSQGSVTASKPADITLGGYAGKSITLRVPDHVDFAECDPESGASWSCGDAPCGYHTGSPTEIDTVYILDVDGQVMAWLTNYHTGTSPDGRGGARGHRPIGLVRRVGTMRGRPERAARVPSRAVG